MNYNEIIERVVDYIEDYNTDVLVEIFNEMVDSTNRADDHVYDISEFERVMADEPLIDLARKVADGDFCPDHGYFWFNAYGNLESSNSPEFDSFDYVEIAQWIVDDDEDCGDPNLRAILDGEEDEEEE